MARKTEPDLDFSQAHISVGGTIHTALTEHRVLTAMLGSFIFVIAHADDKKTALATAKHNRAHYEGYREVFTVLFTDEQLDAIINGNVTLAVPVLNAQRRNQPEPTAIDASNATGPRMETAHGLAQTQVATSSDLRTGDLYTAGAFNEDDKLIVYRVRADYNPDTGSVDHHIVTPGWTDQLPERKQRLGALTGGPDNLVHRITVRSATAMLNRLGIAPLTATVNQ